MIDEPTNAAPGNPENPELARDPLEVGGTPPCEAPPVITLPPAYEPFSDLTPSGRPRLPHQFRPGQPKIGGRRKGTPNKNRSLTIDRIHRTADPIGILCKIARGEVFEVAPEDGSTKVIKVRPTLSDRLLAAKTLAGKVLPDLKAIAVATDAAPVSMQFWLEQKVETGPHE